MTGSRLVPMWPIMSSPTESRAPQQNAHYTPVETTSFQDSQDFPSAFSRTKWGWLIFFATGISLTLAITYAWLVTYHKVNSDPTTVTRNLRILSELVALLFAALIQTTGSNVMWAAVSSKRGLTFATWLSMSSTTGIVGLFKLLFWPHNRQALDWHRLWVITRWARFRIDDNFW